MKTKALMQNTLRALVALLIVATTGPAFAATASELFADGNRLFRDDLYWAALLRYREAADAGMDTPLLHYNTGVAHYKAQQYDRARESLEKAASYGPLAPISHYNLGLAAYALNDYDDALRWFRRAANQDQQKDLSRMARRAIRQLQEQRQSEAPAAIQVALAERERKFTNLDFRFRTGAGIDDNVFRSPSEPYTDQSDPNNPVLVTPEVQSGVYVPVSLNAKYQVNALENEGFFGSYRFGGRFYQDEALK
ncbi:MAG: tetratricopeptide repeat protein, partial [Rhodothermales bacterium]|nr:tetratricopeptide repeat protein [Rhodothermales bacterium]